MGVMSYTGPKFVLQSHMGYFQRVDSWGNNLWTTDLKKAWSSENFHDASIEAQIRGIARQVSIVDANLTFKKK
jgi:hypothetical protein